MRNSCSRNRLNAKITSFLGLKMNALTNLKISKKLILAFGAMLILNVFTSVFALVKMDTINNTSTVIAENWMPSIKAVNDINTTVNTMRLSGLAHILSTDEAAMEEYEGRILALQKHEAEEMKKSGFMNL